MADVKTYMRYSDLFGKEVPLAELTQMLSQFKLSSILFRLAQMNTLVSLEMMRRDDEGMRQVQRALMSTFCDDEVWKRRFSPPFDKVELDARPIFIRQQLNALLRLCVLNCTENAPLTADDKASGAHLFGQCCLIMNDHLVSEEQENALGAGTSQAIRRELAVQLAPTMELNNPPNAERAVVRAEIIFSDILQSPSMRARMAEKVPGLDLQAVFEQSTGISLEKYRDFLFAVLGYYYMKDRKELLDDPGLYKINRTSFISKTIIKQEDFDRFLDLLSVKVSRLSEIMNQQVQDFPSVLAQYDFVTFRKWPLVEMEDGAFVCVDPTFLIEKLGAGIYHTIRDWMPEEEKLRVSGAFGLLFEEYVGEIMQKIYPSISRRFISFPYFERSRNEAFDGIVVFPGGHLIVMEYKGGFLKLENKYSGDINRLENELNLKFGESAGVKQLMTKIEQLFDPTHPRYDRILELEQLGMRITKITPVLVVQEPILHFDFMNWILREPFLRLLGQSKAKDIVEIAPLQVMDIGSLERLKINLIEGDFTLEECLNARAYGDPDMVSAFHAFLYQNFPNYGRRTDPEHEERYKAVYERMNRNVYGEGDES